ncbi:CDP-alcohol phosphatidyltransferase family protein [Rhizobium sp. CG5]|uniref:CDP-alcohol phosphatidyltransferase family protein n=1 Tax=Rhizobium sp. CG5 TaxID=2726076 RepID=UPI002033DEE7|nr:CDP-alcohol phosphatidyltransferase family protein [Rhizobium sp. CG5]MCM2472306.1 CDP-alcohol phosphatidyltransferase family protein [Rhizobium sp. CG5]
MLSNKRSAARAAVMARAPSPALKASALIVLGSIFAAACVSYLVAATQLSLGSKAVVAALALLLLIFALVIKGLHLHRFERFGLANAITAIRAALVCMVAAAVCFAGLPQSAESTLWAFMFIVLAAFALDGVDGYLARRYGQESELGARFDMEVDALLILCLSAAACLLGKAGSWVLLIGLMRYGFVLMQVVLPHLNAPLPPSFRRKLVCVIQVGVLCLVLVPGIAPPVSSWFAAMALLLLGYSFLVDGLYLLKTANARR